MSDRDSDGDRGRHASSPSEIAPRGWKDVLVRVKDDAREKSVPLLSAGVAFYLLLALVPALVAAISVYALLADPTEIQQQIQSLTKTAPNEVAELLAAQVRGIAQDPGAGLVGLAVGLAGAIWAASSGMKHLISAVNDAYGEHEERGFLKLRGLALLFTLGGLVLFVLAVGIIGVLPSLVAGLGGVLKPIVRWAPYAALAGLFAVSLTFVYRYAPNRRQPKFCWVSWGAGFGTLLWVAASVGFSFYVSNFASYNQTYGSMAAVVILMLWLLITAFSILLGAVLNAQLEAQTTLDTTTGLSRLRGERGSASADSVGKTAGQARG